MPPRALEEEQQLSLLESDNDASVNRLFGQISALRGVTIDIHDEMNRQDSLLSSIGSGIESNLTQVKQSFNRMKAVVTAPNNRSFFLAVFLLTIVFLFAIGLMISKATSSSKS
ncbi:uncharacterized protein BJ171DRAFT_578567 [Polychytrium aggregatum]|uniref:uncharacterized protein n=1 Tax=Polychytrium aggregatum TaxID=110093 RepID=UPI0022FE8BC7|nr:uncharacterized protein BJ171DRAFT_578567 [Polychytrium aggregatum]KAI9207446.1 hypothetical protein BJ171DRAFT_578567 [Polychytrium aggregatum]